MFRRFLSVGLLTLAAQVTPAFAQEDPTFVALSKIHLDKTQIYSVRDITITRDVLSISFNRGAIAFTEPIEGKVTGAVFVGSGDILAIPPDSVEKKQLFRYTHAALLSEHFETAVFRFTDGTWEEILKEYRNHASEPVDPTDVDALLRWEAELQRRGVFLGDRILADLIGNKNRPLFLAQIEGARLGWFDAIYDERNDEEILIEQSTTASNVPLVWASFNKRSEAQNPAAVAHEDKSPFELVSMTSDGTQVRLKPKLDGERVLRLPILRSGVEAVSIEDAAIPFFAATERLTIVLPVPTRSGTEITIRIDYAAGGRGAPLSPAASRSGGVAPASYRDQWIVEGLTNYASALTDPAVLAQAREQLLAASPEGGIYESLGPVWIGFRMMQPHEKANYALSLKNKSIWIFHMLRSVIQRDNQDSSLGQMMEEILMQYRGKSVSTFDLKRIAEKYAGKPLDWFFDNWVFGTGIPMYAMKSTVEPAASGFVISGNITQSEVPDTFEMAVPVYADDVFLGYVVVSSAGGEFRFTSPVRPQQILIDPRKTLLTRLN